MINSRDIDDLHPRTAEKCRKFIELCADAGIEIIITSTYRDIESQNALYAKGRTEPGKRVTNVAGGDSYHNWRVAFDFVPVENGKAVWDDKALWQRCGRFAEHVGLVWGGSWRGFVDMPHCQDTNGFSIAEYKSGKATTA